MTFDNKSKSIKSSQRYWRDFFVSISILAFVLIAAIIVAIAEKDTESKSAQTLYVIIWGGGFIAIIAALYGVWAGYCSQIVFESSEIKGRSGMMSFTVPIKDIVVVQLLNDGDALQVIIGTKEKNWQIPCKYFDKRDLEDLLWAYFPAEVFEPSAHQKMAQIQAQWKGFSNLIKPIKIYIGRFEFTFAATFLFCVITMVGTSFFSPPVTYEQMNRSASLIGFFSGLSALSVLLLISKGRIEATAEEIVYKTVFREYRLTWNNINEAYINPRKHKIALVGKKCHIVLPNPQNWVGKDATALVEFINYQIETKKIKLIESEEHISWKSKNFET